MMQARTKRILGALLLGPLTVLSTLAVYFVTIPLQFIVAVGSAFGSPGPFNAFLGLIAIAGDAIVAFASYRVFRSRGLAALTLATALATQAVALGLDNHARSRAAARSNAERDSLGAELDHLVQGYATMGAIAYEVRDPNDQLDNRRPELGPIYRRLTLKVPVAVRESGIYRLRLRYETPDSIGFDSGLLESVDTLGVGEHELSVQFTVGELDYPGLWSPATMGGRATAELCAKVDQARLIRSYLEGKQLGRAQLEVVKQMESVANVAPWRDMWVDSAVTEFPGGVRYPEGSTWGRAPEPSRFTDKQEEELRRRKTEP
jgi:hypothetical protein